MPSVIRNRHPENRNDLNLSCDMTDNATGTIGTPIMAHITFVTHTVSERE